MGTMNIINAIKKNDPIELQKELDFFKFCTNEDYDLNQVVQKNGQKLLHIATKHGSETVFLFLLEPHVNINVTDYNGNTPAHYAIMYGQPKILKLLKEAGADFSKKNNDGHTLDHYIKTRPKKEECKRNKKEFERILMDASSGLTLLAEVAIKYAEIYSKIENTAPKERDFNKVQATSSFFFHSLPREFEYQTDPLHLTKQDNPLNLSITPRFK